MRILYVCVIVLVLATPALGQADLIGVYADPTATDCHPQDIVPQVLRFYVVHLGNVGSYGSQFSVSTGGGFDGFFIGFEFGNIVLGHGHPHTVFSAGYGIHNSCQNPGPVHVLTLNYYCEGTSPPCSYFETTPTVSTNCDWVDRPLDGGITYINATGDCPCRLPVAITPVRETTWGAIKATYLD